MNSCWTRTELRFRAPIGEIRVAGRERTSTRGFRHFLGIVCVYTCTAHLSACSISDSYYGCSKGSVKFNFNDVTSHRRAPSYRGSPLSAERRVFQVSRGERRRDTKRIKPRGRVRSPATRQPDRRRGNLLEMEASRFRSQRARFDSIPDTKGSPVDVISLNVPRDVESSLVAA